MSLDDLLAQQRELAEMFTMTVKKNANKDTIIQAYNNYHGYIRNLTALDKPVNSRLYKLINKIYDDWKKEQIDNENNNKI
ncbi:hypothetical protein KAI04_04380 [Candidatus Pacearchaeota archaeon]|nr:hypothetical protein [Candidatus Pacearchaeota archaeon]